GARLAIAGFLVLGAAALYLADRFGRRRRELTDMTASSALTIGFSQALALFPGISRSGATISAGLALGLTREAAARFSFLLATPITFGAGLYGSRRLFETALTGEQWLAVGVGFVVAALSGLVAIGFLLAWLRRRSVAIFSLYRVLFAALIVVLVLIGH
ncbi:MAG: undecaprenyl-diphosphate phosphatase, partial [Candidatus Limnocylindria bacterium]